MTAPEPADGDHRRRTDLAGAAHRAPPDPADADRRTRTDHAGADQRASTNPADGGHGGGGRQDPREELGVAGGGREGDHPGQPGGAPRSLATRQAELVEALTGGKPVPYGFDAFKVNAARVALLRKRAGEVARQWPMLAAGFGDRWRTSFSAWAATHPTQGSLRDGWDFARDLTGRGELPPIAGAELAEREARWNYDGSAAPRTRRAPAVRSAAGAVAVQVAGRVRSMRRRG
jgi:hypothetical protein